MCSHHLSFDLFASLMKVILQKIVFYRLFVVIDLMLLCFLALSERNVLYVLCVVTLAVY